MKTITYKIKDELGLHARPAGLLVKCIQQFKSKVTIVKDGKEVDGKRLMGVMGLGFKMGDEITINIDGDDASAAGEAIQKFLEENI